MCPASPSRRLRTPFPCCPQLRRRRNSNSCATASIAGPTWFTHVRPDFRTPYRIPGRFPGPSPERLLRRFHGRPRFRSGPPMTVASLGGGIARAHRRLMIKDMESWFDPREVRRLKRTEYDRLVDEGFFEDERIELLKGFLVAKEPQGADHASVTRRLHRLFL